MICRFLSAALGCPARYGLALGLALGGMSMTAAAQETLAPFDLQEPFLEDRALTPLSSEGLGFLENPAFENSWEAFPQSVLEPYRSFSDWFFPLTRPGWMDRAAHLDMPPRLSRLYRDILSTAVVTHPEDHQGLMAYRLDRLLTLGYVAEAQRLVEALPPNDDVSLHFTRLWRFWEDDDETLCVWIRTQDPLQDPVQKFLVYCDVYQDKPALARLGLDLVREHTPEAHVHTEALTALVNGRPPPPVEAAGESTLDPLLARILRLYLRQNPVEAQTELEASGAGLEPPEDQEDPGDPGDRASSWAEELPSRLVYAPLFYQDETLEPLWRLFFLERALHHTDTTLALYRQLAEALRDDFREGLREGLQQENAAETPALPEGLPDETPDEIPGDFSVQSTLQRALSYASSRALLKTEPDATQTTNPANPASQAGLALFESVMRSFLNTGQTELAYGLLEGLRTEFQDLFRPPSPALDSETPALDPAPDSPPDSPPGLTFETLRAAGHFAAARWQDGVEHLNAMPSDWHAHPAVQRLETLRLVPVSSVPPPSLMVETLDRPVFVESLAGLYEATDLAVFLAYLGAESPLDWWYGRLQYPSYTGSGTGFNTGSANPAYAILFRDTPQVGVLLHNLFELYAWNEPLSLAHLGLGLSELQRHGVEPATLHAIAQQTLVRFARVHDFF